MLLRPVRALAAVLGVVLLALAACSAPAPSETPEGPVTITLTGFGGHQIELPRQPKVIVADLYSAAALWEYGIRPAGVFGYGSNDGGMGDVDLSATTVIGLDAEFSLEKLAALQPDVIIGFGSPETGGWTWWDEKVTEQATKVAPFIPIQFGNRSVGDVIDEYRSLAQQLGADVDTEPLAASRSAYDSALQRISDATAAQKLRVLPLSAEVSTIWVGGKQAMLAQLREHGVELVGPTVESGAWAELSWENLTKHPADLIMMYSGTVDAVYEQPLYKRLPAVKSNQVAEWNDKIPYTHREYAEWLNRFADAYLAAAPLKT